MPAPASNPRPGTGHPSADSVRPLRIGSPTGADAPEWDIEADVVVVGYGIAGACAAIEAARAGAEVVILERAGGWGGAAALAGGFIYMGGGTGLQRELGFDDDVENMRAFLTAAMGPGADRAKIDAYCEGSVAHYDWLVDAGVRFKSAFYGEPGWEPPADDGLMYTGGENAAPFNAVAEPAPRGHVPQMSAKKAGEQSAGLMLMTPLSERITELGVRSEYDVTTRRLVVSAGDDGDRVVGVLGTRFGRELSVRARRGVVLAAGSFTYNDAMMRAHVPLLAGRPGSAVEQHDGRAIRMGQAVGADLTHMDAAEVAIHCDPQMMVRGILVNGRGQRFVTEDTYPGRIGQEMALHQGNQAYLILDERAYEEAGTTVSATPFLRFRPKWVGETVAEVEAEMGLPGGALQATVELYNRHAARGEDPMFGKNAQWLRPIEGNIAVIDLRGRTGGFALGGLRTDPDSRVLHVDGDPVPGLFAAGRCTSGIAAWGYASGASLGDGSYFGRRAGISAAAS
ncbi:FAD-dependent oxidoreductase [Tomitella fengzijianii]|uniref:FAD-dependent oxidoreductase n=1 Tax=Tomitella fengzijianii TaxID=2597660 RepID=A0A516X219_9ACTN|nr:FAD-dependent oxidoreductase [Tomitella fengzijianii]QDQ97067.1 FAD-dependent oxidoreductase [Tomitella fengzijianii]